MSPFEKERAMTNELGLYIHIPFCIKKCDYCDFVSYCGKEKYVEKYIEAVKQEIKDNLKKVQGEITTIYIGGGTPSCIASKYIVDIMNTMHLLKKNSTNIVGAHCMRPKETTIEGNPGTVTEEKLQDYKKAGINRLSIGLQETHNRLLQSIGRIHTYEQFVETYQLARKVGFHNINVDLMIGLPDQSIQDIKESLEKIIALAPEHISVYSLILEEGTPLFEKYQAGEIQLPDEELERNMYWYVKNTLENAGYMHYEISNFAKPGFESKHNMNCWEQKEYIGIGVAAHSYVNGTRYSNTSHLDNYIHGVGTQCLRSGGYNPALQTYQTIHETQTTEDMQKEYMLLGLRKIQGVSIQTFKNKFGENPIYLFRNELQELTEHGLLEIDGDAIRLTSKGLDLANIVWQKFI